MQYFEQLILFALLFLISSCQSNEKNNSNEGYRIEWDQNSIVCIADEGGYPRMRRLNDGTLLVFFEDRKGNGVTKRSADEGASWSDLSVVYSGFEYVNKTDSSTCNVNIANPEFIQLENNNILFACNLRPNKNEVFPFSIAVKRSSDNGKSWSDPQIVYEAAPRFIDGCWEPSFLLLPDGTVQIYFANEFPYQQSNEQEISMISSRDNGVTWSQNPVTVSFRKERRDGMPVAVHDNKNIYVAIEDNAVDQFKPYIVQSSLLDNWAETVTKKSSNRHSALKNPVPDSVYAGAPYLIRTDNGLYVLSYQTTGNRTSEWELSTMEVVVSDTPFDFKNPSRPFNVALSKQAKWGSLTDLGNNTVAALSSTDCNSDKIGVWMIKGTITKN